MGSFRTQLRQVLRRLGRSPTFTVIVLLTLGVGIGANTAIFTVVESVLLKPLPYPNASELVGLWHAAPGLNFKELNIAPSNYFIYREQGTAFTDVGIFDGDEISVTGTGDPEKLRAIDVTDGVLPLLGVAPALGRLITRSDDQPGAPKTVMISYSYWHRRFAGDPSVIGRSLTLDGAPFQIIGVLPQTFSFLDREKPDLIVPLQLDRNKTHLGNFSYQGIGRLKPGATLAAANADVDRMLPAVLRTFAPPTGFSLDLFEKAKIAANLHPLMQVVVGDIGDVLWVLMGSIGLVLLIACANVANLLLVRAEGRQHELAVRTALGASRSRIAGELLFESVVIGLLGSVIGLGLAYGGLQLLLSLAPDGLPRLSEVGIDFPALVFTFVISLVASLLFGLVPVVKYAGPRSGLALRDSGRTSSASRERHRARNALVVVQVSLAFVLLICSGLMIRTFHAMTQANPGFNAHAPIQTFGISIPEDHMKEPERVVQTWKEIRRRITEIPGVSDVAMTNSIPLSGMNSNDPIFAQDHSYASGELPAIRRFNFVSPEIFSTLGIPLVAGRSFTWAETDDKRPVAVVGERTARELWKDPQAAIGKRIRVGTEDDWREVIGVAGDVREDGINQEAPAAVYWPLLLVNFESEKLRVRRYVTFAVKSPRAGSESFMKEVRSAIWSVDGNLPIANVRTLEEIYTKSLARTSFTFIMLGLAGGMALLLGVVGLYGVIAYSVSKRTREIGIRMALGAKNSELLGMFVRQGMFLTLGGVAVGLVVALLAMRLISSLLFNVSAVDPLTYIAVSVGLLVTAGLASYLPSRKAATVDPSEALRSE